MTTSFEELQAHFGPNGQGSRGPCPCKPGLGDMEPWNHAGCTACHGTGTVLDTDNTFFKALWQENAYYNQDTHQFEPVPRFHAEAALALLDAARPAGHPVNLITLGSLHPEGIYYRAWCGGEQGDGAVWEEAVAAAILAQEKARETP